MKKVILLVVLALSTLLTSQSFASFAGACTPYSGTVIQRDPGDAFPWGNELPFPWRGIQGTWQTSIDGCAAYFSFKPVKTTSGVNQLQVIQYNPNTCAVVARGVGFEGTRVVSAVLTDNRRHDFNVTVHVFNRADLRSGNMIAFAAAKTVTVMNISPLGSAEDLTSHELEKISTDPKGICP